MPERRLFCFGLGYSAARFAERLRAEGWAVAGTCRGAEKAVALAARGIDTFRFDRGRPLDDARAALAGTTHLLSSVPPDEAGDAVLDHHGADIARLGSLDWVAYLSTTGVYGDRAGGIVDEDSPLEPTSARARRRVEAETGWRALWRARGLDASRDASLTPIGRMRPIAPRHAPRQAVHIFRLAGIYGPGRSAFDQLRAGTARRVAKPGHVFSRIHVDDIAGALCASLARPRPGAVYNLCDDNPAPGEEVVAYAATLLGVAPPPLIPLEAAQLSPMAESFYRDNKRVSNARIKRELGFRLKYPDYRAGLAAILASGE